MSAYMCDRRHIAYLVAAMRRYEVATWEPVSDEERGQALWDENRMSVEARYPDTVGHPEDMPGPVGESFRFNEADVGEWCSHRFDPVQVVKACQCYEYQSCEHDGWNARAGRSSRAKGWIESLTAHAIGVLPGYDEAEWGAPHGEERRA